MFNFYKEATENFEDVFKLNNKITKALIKENILKMSDFEEYVLPYSMDQIIPRIENIAGDAKLLTDKMSEILNIESFLSVDQKEISKNSFYGKDFIVLNNVYFTTNPLSNYISTLIKNIKKYTKEEVLFSKIGYISTYELKKIHNDLENNIIEYMEPLNISNIKIESIISDLVTEGIERNSSFIRIYFKKGSVKAGFNIGHQLVEEDIISCSLDEYILLSRYIVSMFSKKVIFKEYKTERFKLKLKTNKSTEDSTTIDVLDIKLSNLGEKIFDMNQIRLPVFDKKEFERKNELPSGLLVVSSKNSLKENIYSMIKHQVKLKPTQKLYTVEAYIERAMDNVIQFEMNDGLKWTDLNLFDYPIIAIDEIKTPEELNILINAASRGNFVILGVNSNSSIESFSKLHHFSNNHKILADNLLGIVHMDKVPKVCQYCSTEIEFIKSPRYQDFSLFENAPKMNALIKIENPRGCDNCLNGYEGMIDVCEYLTNDEILKENILEKFNLKSLRIEKNSNSWENTFESAAKLLADGITSPNAIINSLGRPRKN